MYSCFLIGYIKNTQLSNSSINLVYIHFDQKDINYEPTKQQKNVDDKCRWQELHGASKHLWGDNS